jgi:serine/threonine protein kinase
VYVNSGLAGSDFFSPEGGGFSNRRCRGIQPGESPGCPFAPGVRIGPYEILSLLGEGGMGEVWKARDSRLDRTVAISG